VWHYCPFQIYVEFGLVFLGFMIMLLSPPFFLPPSVHEAWVLNINIFVSLRVFKNYNCTHAIPLAL
jgi:hypothetical protein